MCEVGVKSYAADTQSCDFPFKSYMVRCKSLPGWKAAKSGPVGTCSDRMAGQCCRSTWTDGSAATGSLRILLVLWKEISFHLSLLSAGRSNHSNSHHHVAYIHSVVKSRTGSHSQYSVYWSCLWGIQKTLTWAMFWDSARHFFLSLFHGISSL